MATPFVKVRDVDVPIAVVATVGGIIGLDDDAGPENVKDFTPV